MAGGNWSPTSLPVLPGFFMNFQAAALAAIQSGPRGIVALPVKAHWGPVGEFVTITSEDDIVQAYTDSTTGNATAYTSLRLALLGGASKIVAYRLSDGTAAKASLTLQDDAGTPADAMTITAMYPGERGNSFAIVVQANVADAGKQDLKLYEGAELLRTITFDVGSIAGAIAAINDDDGNRWITAALVAEGSGTLATLTSTSMTGGVSGITGIDAADYVAALSAMETQTFNVLALDGISDSSLQTSVVSWIDRVRSEGKNVQAVLGGSAADDTASDAVSKATTRSALFNHEGVINVGTGASLGDVSYSSAQLSAYVAGLVAGTALSSSTTYAPAPFADVTRRWTRSEQEQAVRGGVFLLVHDGRQVKVLKGINSLTSIRTGQNNAWKKIRTISVMDAINTDLLQTAEDSYIGKVNNTAEGRLALLGAMKKYMGTLANAGIIEATGYDVYLDPAYYGSNPVATPEPDQVFVKWTAKMTDVMEQILGTFIVQ